jgi:hypothetical protein
MRKHALRVIPGDTVPAIEAMLAGGGRWALAREKPAKLALLVKPEGGLYAAWIQSTPYARVHFAEILTAVDNFIAKGVPEPRGSA